MCILYRHVMRFNSYVIDAGSVGTEGDASILYSQLAPLVFSDAELAVGTKESALVVASRFADCLHALGYELQLPMRLRDVGIQEVDLPRLASEAMKQTRLLPNNPRQVTLSDALNLYTRAW